MTVCVLAGRSMKPFLQPGALLLLEPVALGEITVGNVVVFRTGAAAGRMVAHRVVSVKHIQGRLAVRTQGDNAACDDNLLTAERLVGRVRAHWQRGRLRRRSRVAELAALTLARAGCHLRRGPAALRLAWRMGVVLMKRLFKANQELVFRREGDEALLFNPQSGEIHLLNATGAEVWRMLAESAAPEAIVERLMADYDATDRTAVEADVRMLLEKMQRTGLVAATTASAGEA
jgi:PqqD family protein of HPr-rel-A system